jgi:hypothetical protein
MDGNSYRAPSFTWGSFLSRPPLRDPGPSSSQFSSCQNSSKALKRSGSYSTRLTFWKKVAEGTLALKVAGGQRREHGGHGRAEEPSLKNYTLCVDRLKVCPI